jgi:hypothetical protein
VSSVDLTNNNNTALGFVFFPLGTWFFPDEPPNAFEIDGQPTPEPSSLILSLTGLIALIGGVCRSKASRGKVQGGTTDSSQLV